jgi:hypothetical protein
LRLLLDEDFNNDVLRGLLRRKSDVDVVRVQDVEEIAGASDPEILAWAGQEGRVVFTHDVSTMTAHAIERIEAEQPVPGIFVVSQDLPIGPVIEDMLLLIEGSKASEWANLILYFPL